MPTVSAGASLVRPRTQSTKEQNETTTSPQVSTWAYFLVLFIFCVGFWFPEHGWNQSVYFANLDELVYDGSENLTADKLNGINTRATVSRILLCMFGLACFWFQRRFRLRVSAPILWIGLAFAAVVYASSLWSINPTHTLFKLVVLSCLGGAALGFATAFTLRQLLEWLALACAIYISLGILAEISLGTFAIGGNHRFVGTVHPNTEAIFGAVLCLSARLFYTPDRSKVLTICFLALAVFCIYLTKSRTTLAAVVVSFIVMQILAARGSNRVYLILACFFAFGCIAAGSILLSVRNTGQISSIIAMGRTEDLSTLTGRLPLWEELLDWVYRRPVLGYGYLAFWDAKRVEFLSQTFFWEIPHGHNMYIDIALDVGLVGAVLFVSMLVGAIITAARIYARTNQVEYAIVVGIYICAIINGIGESLFKLPGLPLFVLVSTFIALMHDVEEPKLQKKLARKTSERVLRDENG